MQCVELPEHTDAFKCFISIKCLGRALHEEGMELEADDEALPGWGWERAGWLF